MVLRKEKVGDILNLQPSCFMFQLASCFA